MPMGLGQMKYLVLAREDLTNQVEEEARGTKWWLWCVGSCSKTSSVNAICKQGELNGHEATELFERLGVQLSLTTSYKPEANGKIEREHMLVSKAIVRAYEGWVRDYPRLLPYAFWANKTTHSLVTGVTD